MAQIATRAFTPNLSLTYFTALARGNPPRMRTSMYSSELSPLPDPQQNVCSRIVFSGISLKLLQTFRKTYRGSSSIPIPRAILHESWNVVFK